MPLKKKFERVPKYRDKLWQQAMPKETTDGIIKKYLNIRNSYDVATAATAQIFYSCFATIHNNIYTVDT